MIRKGSVEDIEIINQIFNATEVAPFHNLNPELFYDFTDSVNDEKFIYLLNDTNDAMSMWENKGDDLYEGHTMFLNTCRGKSAIKTGKEMMMFMKEELNITNVYGHTPISNLAARKFSKMIGFESHGLTKNGCGVVEVFKYNWNKLNNREIGVK